MLLQHAGMICSAHCSLAADNQAIAALTLGAPDVELHVQRSAVACLVPSSAPHRIRLQTDPVVPLVAFAMPRS